MDNSFIGIREELKRNRDGLIVALREVLKVEEFNTIIAPSKINEKHTFPLSCFLLCTLETDG